METGKVGINSASGRWLTISSETAGYPAAAAGGGGRQEPLSVTVMIGRTICQRSGPKASLRVGTLRWDGAAGGTGERFAAPLPEASMKRLLHTHSVMGQVTVIAVIALTLALGLCGFDRDGDGTDDQGMDFCAMPIATATGILLVAPGMTGWSVNEIACFASDAAPYPPDPPPKLTAAI